MTVKEELQKQLDSLVRRNEVIDELKQHPKFRIITGDGVKEYTLLEEEEKANLHRIEGIEQMLRQMED